MQQQTKIGQEKPLRFGKTCMLGDSSDTNASITKGSNQSVGDVHISEPSIAQKQTDITTGFPVKATYERVAVVDNRFAILTLNY